MLGLAIGDALGQPFEFSSAKQIIQSGWDGGMTYGDVWKLNPGQYTDDTLMALCIAKSLIEMGRFDLADVGEKYVEWVNTGDLRGIGNTCATSIHRIRMGYPLLKCGQKPNLHSEEMRPSFKRSVIKTDEPSIELDADLYGIGDFCGNGTLMRCAPIGLFYHKNPSQRDRAAINDATMTHDHSDARDSSKFLCSVVADLANNCGLHTAICNAMLKKYEYDHVQRLVQKAIDMVDVESSGFIHAADLGNTGTAHGTLATAVFCCLKYTSFKDAVTAAVLIAGDTDTRAAVVGAIMGTAYGLQDIPVEWVEIVEDSDRLQDIDSKLYYGEIY